MIFLFLFLLLFKSISYFSLYIYIFKLFNYFFIIMEYADIFFKLIEMIEEGVTGYVSLVVRGKDVGLVN